MAGAETGHFLRGYPKGENVKSFVPDPPPFYMGDEGARNGGRIKGI
jgi:hypothetical protein